MALDHRYRKYRHEPPGGRDGRGVGLPHPKWGERPIVLVVRRKDAVVSREEVLGLYEGKLAKWQTPDDVVFVDNIPLGATGKMLKTELRKVLEDYALPDTASDNR
ncbi:AMP-binding enzyme [Pseudomonas sp. UBA6323]|uniref:AMP-binding enzyme n=1 Tax=Pseudomonas sp. UBA6323 TaxID=1947329 RepID=UPI0025E68C97|nr:hypothetical protein [Pseudomonas sp. UBA6323]